MLKKTFNANWETEIYILKVQLLEPIVGEFKTFGSLHLLKSNLFEQYNVRLKSAYIATRRRRRSVLEEAVEMVINCHIHQMASLNRTCSGLCQPIANKWD